MNVIPGRVTESGRLTLPAQLRKAVGLERGGDVVFQLDGRDIRTRTVSEVVDRAQALTQRLLGKAPDASVAAFLAERRLDR